MSHLETVPISTTFLQWQGKIFSSLQFLSIMNRAGMRKVEQVSLW